jgi:RNA polymerase sporulation-specific sigma factor
MLEMLLKTVGNMLFLMLHIGSEASFPKPLGAKREREELEKMKQGDKTARETLIIHNLRLVAHIIKKYYSAYSEQEDLISIGTIGLIKGIDSFDMDKGIRLATYVSRCVENEVLMYLRGKKKSSLDISLNEPIDTDSEGNPLTLIDVIYTDDTIADDLDLKIKSEKVRKYVSFLPDKRERQIITERFGLDGGEPKTQREIAKELNISRSYVSRIEKKALEHLRDMFENNV